MLTCRLRQGTRVILAPVAPREAVAGNWIAYRGSDWQVVSVVDERAEWLAI